MAWLDDTTLDYEPGGEARDFRDILANAYTESDALREVCSNAGLDVGEIFFSEAPNRLPRPVMNQAARQGRMRHLVREVLKDASVAGFHDRVRGLFPPGDLRVEDTPNGVIEVIRWTDRFSQAFLQAFDSGVSPNPAKAEVLRTMAESRFLGGSRHANALQKADSTFTDYPVLGVVDYAGTLPQNRKSHPLLEYLLRCEGMFGDWQTELLNELEQLASCIQVGLETARSLIRTFDENRSTRRCQLLLDQASEIDRAWFRDANGVVEKLSEPSDGSVIKTSRSDGLRRRLAEARVHAKYTQTDRSFDIVAAVPMAQIEKRVHEWRVGSEGGSALGDNHPVAVWPSDRLGHGLGELVYRDAAETWQREAEENWSNITRPIEIHPNTELARIETEAQTSPIFVLSCLKGFRAQHPEQAQILELLLLKSPVVAGVWLSEDPGNAPRAVQLLLDMAQAPAHELPDLVQQFRRKYRNGIGRKLHYFQHDCDLVSQL